MKDEYLEWLKYCESTSSNFVEFLSSIVRPSELQLIASSLFLRK
jgi:hypothetical protein